MDFANLPKFIPSDVQTIFNDLVLDYETRIGRKLLPAQAEYLFALSVASRFKVHLDATNDGLRTQLFKYSRAPFLDLLVEFLGVTRLPAQYATTTIRFQLVAGYLTFNIPAGIRIQSSDGKVVFETLALTVVTTGGPTFIDVPAICQTSGTTANDYAIGTINTILDPVTYVSSAANTVKTAGGSDIESDDQLRERARLAPNSFNSAGSRMAYIYWALTAHPSIIDVAVPSVPTVPGTVEVYPLTATATVTPAPIIAAVDTLLNQDRIKALNDTIVVASPSALNYDIEVELTVYNSAVDADVITAVQLALDAFAFEGRMKLGRDRTLSKIIGLCMVPGVYSTNVVLPIADVVAQEADFAICNSITITIIAHTNG